MPTGTERSEGKAAGVGVNVVVVKRRIIVGLAVSAVTVERPKQLRSTNPHHTRSLFIPLPSSSLPSARHQRESVAWPQLSWPLGWSCSTQGHL